MVIRKSNKRVRNNHAKKTRPVVRYNNNNNNRQNHAETQDGGMILGFDGPVQEISQHNIREIINRLFVGICGVASTRDGDFLAGTSGIMYADIGGTLTKIDGKTNEYRLETPFGIETAGRRSDKPVYSNPATNTFLLTPSAEELAAYKEQAATVNKQIWDGSIIDMIYAGNMQGVNELLASVKEPMIKFSIATSTTLSIGKIPTSGTARHTLLYVASRSLTADKAMVEALIRHGCIVNQPNPPRVGKKTKEGVRPPEWTSGATVMPIWGAVKTMCGVSGDEVVPVLEELITMKKELVITLIRYGANVQAIHYLDGDRIRAFIVRHKPDIFVKDRHFETYFTLRAPLLSTADAFEYTGWTAENVANRQNVTKYTKTVGRSGALYNQQAYVTYQYPHTKYDLLPMTENLATEHTTKMIAEAERVLKCLETPVVSGVDVCGAVCFGIDMNDLRRVFFKADCNEVFLKFHDANVTKKQLAVGPSMDFSHTSTIKSPVEGIICFSERHKWGVSEDPDKMESAMYTACRSPFTTPDTIEKLIQLGFGVDVPNRLPRGRSADDTSFGSTPLHGVVERLRQAISQQNNHAEVANCIRIIELLQKAGADVNARNNIIQGGRVFEMTAKQEFDNFATVEGNPHKYAITTVGGLLTTGLKKTVTWTSTQEIMNFYNGAKCIVYDGIWTDDYVNMFCDSSRSGGMGHSSGKTHDQLVITHTLGGSKVAAAATSKPSFVSSFKATVASAAHASAPAPTPAVAPKLAAVTAPKPAAPAAAAPSLKAAAEQKRVATSVVLDTEHELYAGQLPDIIKRLNKKLKVADNTTYGWTAYYNNRNEASWIEKMATKAYSSFSEVMEVALKCFSVKIDVLEYGETNTKHMDGTSMFKVWVVPMLPDKKVVDAEQTRTIELRRETQSVDVMIEAHKAQMKNDHAYGNTRYGAVAKEITLKKEFPLYSDELIMHMAILNWIHCMDDNNSDFHIKVNDGADLYIRKKLTERIAAELLIQNDIFIASLTQNFGEGTAQEFGYSGKTLIGFILDKKYEYEQLARDASIALAVKKKLPADNFHAYNKNHKSAAAAAAGSWQILIASPLKMLSKSIGIWKWESDDGSVWNLFEKNKEPATLLEVAFKTGQSKVEYKHWTFDLQNVKQTSAEGEKSSRAIWRQITGTTDVVPAVAAAAPSLKASATPAPGPWQYQSDDGKTWTSFVISVNAALEDAYKYKIPRITIVTKNPAPQPPIGSETVTWWFDMKNNLQINTTTFSSRQIRREPPIHVKFQEDNFVGMVVDWYLGDVKCAEKYSVEIDKQYQDIKTATSVKISDNDDNTFNFATMMGINSKVEFVLTRVCLDPPQFSDVDGNALHISTKSGILTVEQCCKMVWEPKSTEKINIALTEGRLINFDKFVAITDQDPNGNSGLYCACRAHHTTVYSIRRLVTELGLNVNLPNSGNKSTPLHGLVQRLKVAIDTKISAAAAVAATATAALAAEYGRILAIMKFLVEQKADCTLANTVPNGGTALEEFTKFTPAEKAHLTDAQIAEITALLTPKPAAASASSSLVAAPAASPKVLATFSGTAAAAASSASGTAKVASGSTTAAAATQALSNLVTSAYVPELQQLIKTNHNSNLKAYVDTVVGNVSKSADLKAKIIAAARNLKDTTVGDIDDTYRSLFKAVTSSTGTATFTIVGPIIDALVAPRSKLMDDSIVQVASQFNYLESMDSEYTEITQYYRDNTQGPRASVASLEALILRDAAIKPTGAEKLGQQPVFNGISWYRNGYLTPRDIPKQDVQIAVTRIDQNIRNLRILAQVSISEFSSTKKPYIQVFSAAPSFQIGNQAQSTPPDKDSIYDSICVVLVLAQYTSIAKLAVIKSIANPSKPVNLHLTAVGQGAFSNHPSLYDKFITAVWKIVKPFNVSVFMHVYGSLTDPHADRVIALNALFTQIDPSAKTATDEQGVPELPKLSAEKFISWPS
jgi:hypothetical protein